MLLQARKTDSADIIDRAEIASRVDTGFLVAGGFELAESAWGELFVEARYQRGYRALLPGGDGQQETLSLLLGFGLGHDIYDSSDSLSPSSSQDQRNNVPPGQPGYRERVQFDNIIGSLVKDGVATPTRNAIIHYGKEGIHIVPAAP